MKSLLMVSTLLAALASGDCFASSRSVVLGLSLTVPPREELDVLPGNKVHIISNTGRKLESVFDLNGLHYELVNCDLSAGHYIDTVCDMQITSVVE